MCSPHNIASAKNDQITNLSQFQRQLLESVRKACIHLVGKCQSIPASIVAELHSAGGTSWRSSNIRGVAKNHTTPQDSTKQSDEG